tara:strand:+ start:2353 stop:2985 length:633 start_codon:yes stop_codon:yes gene_type:complete
MTYNEDYQKVADRQAIFKKEYPTHKITTHLLDTCIIEGKHQVIIKCEILNGSNKVAATGIASEREGSSSINKTSWVENAETSAIGRAFRALGIGDNENYASKEEVVNAKQKLGTVEKKEKVSKGKSLTEKAKKNTKKLDLSFITDNRKVADLKKIANGLKMFGITRLQLTPALKRYDPEGKYKDLATFMVEMPTKELITFITEYVVKNKK